jgi:alkylation response protein AidB-like acyl-CoA dehydrogenase
MATETEDRPLDRARAIAPLIAAEARESERVGRLTGPVSTALKSANLFSMLRPRSRGGLGGSRVEFFETVEEIARADGAAGWCLSVCAAVIEFIHQGASAEANADVFGAGPVAVWTSLLPRAVSEPVGGGYQVSGSFSMGSGSCLADWVLVASPLEDRGANQWFRAHILPRHDVVIDPASWDVMGLRGTASVAYSLQDVFVPGHRAFEYPYFKGGERGSVSTLSAAFLNQIGLTAFASGVAQRAMGELIAAAPKTRRTVGEGFQSDDNVVQFGVGEFEGRVAAARTHFISRIADQDRQIAERGFVDASGSLSMSQAAQILARASRDMTIFAFDNAGTNVVFCDHPLQRCLRDIFTGLKHASMTPAILTRAGKARLGVRAAPSRLT